MARPAGRTQNDVKPPIPERWAQLSRTPGLAPAPAPRAPRPQESLRLKQQLGTPGLKLRQSFRLCPRPFPPPSSLLPEPEAARPYRAAPN